MDIKVRDKFILHSQRDYKIEVVSVSNFREPSMKYALDVRTQNGEPYSDDYVFVGDDFFINNADKITGDNNDKD